MKLNVNEFFDFKALISNELIELRAIRNGTQKSKLKHLYCQFDLKYLRID